MIIRGVKDIAATANKLSSEALQTLLSDNSHSLIKRGLDRLLKRSKVVVIKTVRVAVFIGKVDKEIRQILVDSGIEVVCGIVGSRETTYINAFSLSRNTADVWVANLSSFADLISPFENGYFSMSSKKPARDIFKSLTNVSETHRSMLVSALNTKYLGTISG